MGEFVGGKKLSELISRDQAITAMLKEQEDDIEAYGCPIQEGFDGDRAVRVLAKLPSIDIDISEYSDRLWKTAYERGKAEGVMNIDTNIPIIEQIRWERDTAIAQLAEIGKGLGERMDDVEKVVRCKDCKFASYEPYKDFINVYICNYSQWTRAEGGRYPDWYCARAERRTDA